MTTIEETMQGSPILWELAEARVFQIRETSFGFNLVEGCDDYFSLTLTPNQLRALAQELVTLADIKDN